MTVHNIYSAIISILCYFIFILQNYEIDLNKKVVTIKIVLYLDALTFLKVHVQIS